MGSRHRPLPRAVSSAAIHLRSAEIDLLHCENRADIAEILRIRIFAKCADMDLCIDRVLPLGLTPLIKKKNYEWGSTLYPTSGCLVNVVQTTKRVVQII